MSQKGWGRGERIRYCIGWTNSCRQTGREVASGANAASDDDNVDDEKCMWVTLQSTLLVKSIIKTQCFQKQWIFSEFLTS